MFLVRAGVWSIVREKVWYFMGAAPIDRSMMMMMMMMMMHNDNNIIKIAIAFATTIGTLSCFRHHHG